MNKELDTGRRVLVIDDYSPTLDAFCNLLESWGYVVTYAATASDGVAAFAAWTPDMVVLQPGDDGLDVIRRVRAMSPEVFIIAVAASLRSRGATYDAGADCFVLRSGIDTLRRALVRGEAETSARAAARIRASESLSLLSGGHMTSRALVIDDCEDMRGALQRLLGTWGYHVEAAATGSTGLTAYFARSPHVVVTDLALPDIKGWDVIRQMRAAARDVLIVAYSGYEELLPLGLNAGADGSVLKPHVDRLREVLGTAGSGARRVVRPEDD